MSVWTILHGEDEETFADLGLASLTRTRVNQDADVVSFVADGEAFDGTVLFPYGDTVTIKQDGVVWFVGTITQVPRFGSPREESITYRVSGPWHDLDRLTFQQTWKMWDAIEEELTDQYKTRVILGQNSDGDRIHAGAVVTEILAFAAANGISLAAGTITPDIEFPWDEATDIMCGEALRKVLKWVPDGVTWFDYATTPPTLHCKRRSEMTAVDFNIVQCEPNHELSITARNDLQVPAVVIKYEQTHTVDGMAYESVSTDAWPAESTGLEPGALNMTVQLAGIRVTRQSQDIEVVAMPGNLNDEDWWKTKVEWLNDDRITAITIHDAERVGHAGDPGPGDEYYANELTKGTIHDWMTEDVEEDLIEVMIDYTIAEQDEAGNIVEKVENKRVTYNFVATDLDSGTYSRTAGVETGEAVPSGVAQKIYDAANALHYDGSFIIEEEEVSGNVFPGRTINLTDSDQEAWATMNAPVQEVIEEVDSGRTTIGFGPPEHLGPVDLIELMRGNRGRRTSTLWKARTTGNSADAGSSVAADGYSPASNISNGPGEPIKQNYRTETGDYTQAIKDDPTLISKTDADVNIQPRELRLLDGSTSKLRQVMCSDGYGDSEGGFGNIGGSFNAGPVSMVDLKINTGTNYLQIRLRTVTVANGWITISAFGAWANVAGWTPGHCETV